MDQDSSSCPGDNNFQGLSEPSSETIKWALDSKEKGAQIQFSSLLWLSFFSYKMGTYSSLLVFLLEL